MKPLYCHVLQMKPLYCHVPIQIKPYYCHVLLKIIIIIIIIIYHEFFPQPRRGSHVKPDNIFKFKFNKHTFINIHPWAHILDICALIFSCWSIFNSLSQPNRVTASHPPLQVNKHKSTGGRSERTQGQAKIAANNSFSCICARTLHSFRSLSHWRAASTVILLLAKATFTPSIQPNLSLPRTRPPLTSAINGHTLWSALFANSIS